MILRHRTLFTTVTPVLCMVLRKQRCSIDKIINETMHANAKVGTEDNDRPTELKQRFHTGGSEKSKWKIKCTFTERNYTP